MKKTSEIFETPSLEREENLGFDTLRAQPTPIGRNIGATQFGFGLPVTQNNPQLAYSSIPVSIPVVNQQQPYFGYSNPALQPVNIAGIPAVNPMLGGYALQNPLLANQLGYQSGLPSANIPVAFNPVQFAGTPVQYAGIPSQQQYLVPQAGFLPTQQPLTFYNPVTGTLATQEQLLNSQLGGTGLQTQPIPVSMASALTNGKKDFISWIPEANIIETDKTFKIELAVPGITRETCKVGVDKGILWVTGSRSVDTEMSKPISITKKEFSYGSFYRSFLLTENLENEKIQVSCHHGLLTINIPKKELTKRIATEIAVN